MGVVNAMIVGVAALVTGTVGVICACGVPTGGCVGSGCGGGELRVKLTRIMTALPDDGVISTDAVYARVLAVKPLVLTLKTSVEVVLPFATPVVETSFNQA